MTPADITAHFIDLRPHLSALGGASSAFTLLFISNVFTGWAKRCQCTPARLADSIARRLLAFVLALLIPRLRGRHRMWRLYHVQELIRADHRHLTRRS